MVSIENRTSLLHPYIEKSLLQALKDCKEQNLSVKPFETLRLPSRQNALFVQKKTKAKAGESNHQFGLAVDLVFVNRNKLPTWKGDWNAVGKIMMKHGFAWGRYFSSFPEDCHFEMTFDIPKKDLREAWAKHGVAGCFKLVDAKLEKQREASKKLPLPVITKESHVSIVEIVQRLLSIVSKFRKKKNG